MVKTQIEIFQAHTFEELSQAVNAFLLSFKDVEVSDISLSENEYNYKIVLVYKTNG